MLTGLNTFIPWKIAKVQNFMALFMALKPYFAKTNNSLIPKIGSEWAFLLMSECAQGFLQDYQTFIALICSTQLYRHCIGAINLTALVTPLSKTGFHQTIEQRLRQIQIQFKQCSTTLLASKQKWQHCHSGSTLKPDVFVSHSIYWGKNLEDTRSTSYVHFFCNYTFTAYHENFFCKCVFPILKVWVTLTELQTSSYAIA